jgi:hypothetical protein
VELDELDVEQEFLVSLPPLVRVVHLALLRVLVLIHSLVLKVLLSIPRVPFAFQVQVILLHHHSAS